jgi:nucleotide-binding universal stress UspA family protein
VHQTAALCVDGVEDDVLVDAAKEALSACARVEAWCAYGAAAERLMQEILERHHGPRPHPPPGHPSLDAEQAEAIAGRGAALLAHAGLDARPRVLGGSDAGHAIAGASTGDVLLVLAAGHRREEGPKSVGHVARFVIDRARGPVLVVRLPG